MAVLLFDLILSTQWYMTQEGQDPLSAGIVNLWRWALERAGGLATHGRELLAEAVGGARAKVDL